MKRQKNIWFSFCWIILIFLMLWPMNRVIADEEVNVDSQVGVTNTLTFSPQGSDIPRQYPETPPLYVYAPPPPAPVQLVPEKCWNEDNFFPIFKKKDTWTMEELSQLDLKKVKFEEFDLWINGLKPTDKIKVILPEGSPDKPDKKIFIIPKDLPPYQVIGKAVVTAHKTAFKITLAGAKKFAQSGADGVIVTGAGAEKEQDDHGYALGLGPFITRAAGKGGFGVVIGGVYYNGHLEYNALRYVRMQAIKFLEEEEVEVKEAPVEQKAPPAPLVEAKKVVEVAEVLPPPVVIYFDFDSYKILPKERDKIKKMADWLVEHPDHRVQFEGHCCLIGTKDYNAQLGRKRALAVIMEVINLLVEDYGFTEDQIMPELIVQPVSVSEDKPIVENKTKAEGQPNRRVVMRVVGPSSEE